MYCCCVVLCVGVSYIDITILRFYLGYTCLESISGVSYHMWTNIFRFRVVTTDNILQVRLAVSLDLNTEAYDLT